MREGRRRGLEATVKTVLSLRFLPDDNLTVAERQQSTPTDAPKRGENKMGKKKEITAKIIILSDKELKPIREKIAEALAMLIDLVAEKAEIMNLSSDSKRAFIDEMVMMLIGETLIKWVNSMQSATLMDLQQQIKKFLEEAKKNANK